MSNQERVGLYLHFPYCRSRCSYCDYNAHLAPQSLEPQRAYIEALLTDIRAQDRYTIRSVSMGGGTPSLARPEWLAEVLEAAQNQFDFEVEAEISLEANPGTIDQAGLTILKQAGITRISYGVQAFQSHLLTLLGRDHQIGDVEQSVEAARAADFDNLNLDLIYGLPEQTLDDWSESLEKALQLSPEHLCIYQLMVEPSTRLEAQVRLGHLVVPEEEATWQMDQLTKERLGPTQFKRYEISNWAVPGRECQQNWIYWRDEPYLGLGCGAVGYLNGWRSKRIQHPDYYVRAIRAGRHPYREAERLGFEAALKDTLMLGLRTVKGIDLESVWSRYPKLTRSRLEGFFQDLPPEWFELDSERVKLTPKGIDLHSEVYFRLMDTALIVG